MTTMYEALGCPVVPGEYALGNGDTVHLSDSVIEEALRFGGRAVLGLSEPIDLDGGQCLYEVVRVTRAVG